MSQLSQKKIKNLISVAKVLEHARPSSPQRCFFVVASCQIKAKNGHWDKLDCLEDNKVIDCCQFECSKNRIFFFISILFSALKQVLFSVFQLRKRSLLKRPKRLIKKSSKAKQKQLLINCKNWKIKGRKSCIN